MAKKRRKPFVYDTTIWKSVKGGFSNPDESGIYRVGKHRVLLRRSKNLNSYGNPVHTATVIKGDGTLGSSYKSTASASTVVSCALKKNGIETKRKRY